MHNLHRKPRFAPVTNHHYMKGNCFNNRIETSLKKNEIEESIPTFSIITLNFSDKISECYPTSINPHFYSHISLLLWLCWIKVLAKPVQALHWCSVNTYTIIPAHLNVPFTPMFGITNLATKSCWPFIIKFPLLPTSSESYANYTSTIQQWKDNKNATMSCPKANHKSKSCSNATPTATATLNYKSQILSC